MSIREPARAGARLMLSALAGATALAGTAAAYPIGTPPDPFQLYASQLDAFSLISPLPLKPFPDPPYDPDNPWPPNCLVCGQNAFLQQDPGLIRQDGKRVLFGLADQPLSVEQVRGYKFRAIGGPLIQIPTVAYPVTIAVRNKAMTANGRVTLSDADLCGIFSGRLTDWGRIAKPSLEPGPITVVYRHDASASASLLTSHLAAVCTKENSDFAFPIMPTPVLWGLFAKGVPANFVAAEGGAGAQRALRGLTSAVGFMPPNFTSIAPKAAETSDLRVAALLDPSGSPVLPTVANTGLAIANPGRLAVNPKPPIGSAAADPMRWLPADPLPAKGYPIVGFGSGVFSTCYGPDDSASAKTARQFSFVLWREIVRLIIVNWTTTPIPIGLDHQYGFEKLPQVWSNAVAATFTTNKSGLNLNVQNPAVCKGLPGI